jgi:hypothetical protein
MADAKNKLYDFANNMVAGFLCAGVSMIAAILYTHFGPTWARPIMNGLIAGAITLTLFLCVRAILALPRAQQRIAPDTIAPILLSWLHKFNLEVKMLSENESFFMYRVTTDGGKVITLRRTRNQFSDYISVRALISRPDDIKKHLDALTDQQKAVLRIKLSLALSKGVIGYKTDAWLSEDLWIFKHVPISPTLTEETVVNAIWEVEAMVGIVYNTAALYLIETGAVDVSKLIEASSK